MGAQGFITDSFEVLSPETKKANLSWKLYTSTVSTNALYVPEVILLQGQQPQDSPHYYHSPLALQVKVGTCMAGGRCQILIHAQS